MNQRKLGIVAVAVVAGAAMLALAGCAVGASLDQTGADASDAGLVAQGAAIYRQHCASCHGDQLEGQPNWRVRRPDGTLPAPPHDASGHAWHHTDGMLFEITKRGTAAVVPSPYRSNMPGFSNVLDDREIWAVLAFIKSTWPPELREAQPVGTGMADR